MSRYIDWIIQLLQYLFDEKLDEEEKKKNIKIIRKIIDQIINEIDFFYITFLF